MSLALPIRDVLPELLSALSEQTGAVLIAPPGAGKTTVVAAALLKEEWCTGTVILTSPRRIAARAAAERMAEMLGERAGATIGYLTRLDSKRSAQTRVIVMTEAIFVNTILADPELGGVSAVLFDEAHERHLDSDLGMALALESRAVLREDLRLVAMSATIEGTRFARLLGPATPVIASEGKAYPLQVKWIGTAPDVRMEDAMASAIVQAYRSEQGDILAFLPGTREIDRVRERVEPRLPGIPVLPLHGQVDPASQRAAIRRDPQGRRRIVLATSIAETSLTLDGVSVVVDSGLARRAEFDRMAGTTHLVTRRASQAAAGQRAGRAARQGPGVVYRLWEEGAHLGRPAFDPPEIETADLSALVLTLARWGTVDPAQLSWIDPPPAPSIAAAWQNLATMGAVDEARRLTKLGERMAQLPMEPAGAASLLFGAEHGAAMLAARIVLLLQERELGGRTEDIETRLARWASDTSARAEASRKLAKRWAESAETLLRSKSSPKPGGGSTGPSPTVILAAGRPDFIAKRRTSAGDSWLSSGGRGFWLDPASPLCRSEFIVIGDAQGQAKGARITAAMPIDRNEIETWFSDRIKRSKTLHWTGERVEPRIELRLGSIVLSRGPDPAPDPLAIVDMLVDKARERLVELLPAQLLARARFAGVAALAFENLERTIGDWLPRALGKRRDLGVEKSAVADTLLNLLDWDERQRLDREAPREFISLAGTAHVIDYVGDDAPSVEVRVQALFGLDRHPMIGQTPLLLKLTSPAGRPLQATRDLPGFWRGSWSDVKKEMKGRYPKHRWPDEPWSEAPSLKTKNAFNKG